MYVPVDLSGGLARGPVLSRNRPINSILMHCLRGYAVVDT